MHWERVLALMSVVEQGGFSAAARALNKTQSAVSQAVAQLESDIGELLLVRGCRPILPTQAGELLVARARRAATEMACAREEIRALAGLRGGRLTIATTDTLGCYFLPPALRGFRERYPEVEVVLKTAPSPRCAQWVADRQVDVGVVTLPLPAGRVHSRLDCTVLASQPQAVIVPADHPMAGRSRVSLARLASLPLLMLGPDTASRVALEHQMDALGLNIVPKMEANSVELLKRLVELGFGVAVVPTMAVEREVGTGTLAALALSPADASRRTGLLRPTATPHSQAAQAFVGELLKTQ